MTPKNWRVIRGEFGELALMPSYHPLTKSATAHNTFVVLFWVIWLTTITVTLAYIFMVISPALILSSQATLLAIGLFSLHLDAYTLFFNREEGALIRGDLGLKANAWWEILKLDDPAINQPKLIKAVKDYRRRARNAAYDERQQLWQETVSPHLSRPS